MNIDSESARVGGIGSCNRTSKVTARGRLEHYESKEFLVLLREVCTLPSGVLYDEGWGGYAIIRGDRELALMEESGINDLETSGVPREWVKNVDTSIPPCLLIHEVISNG